MRRGPAAFGGHVLHRRLLKRVAVFLKGLTERGVLAIAAYVLLLAASLLRR